MLHSNLYRDWGELLSYPAEEESGAVCARIDRIRACVPDLADDLEPLRDYSSTHTGADLEEVFTRTFDSNAERALELGWHLHGENYARGAFMVRMRDLLRRLEVAESSELPDHVSHVLGVLAKADRELTSALARGVVSPALAKIEEGFTDTSNPYFGVITSLKRFVDRQLEAESSDD